MVGLAQMQVDFATGCGEFVGQVGGQHWRRAGVSAGVMPGAGPHAAQEAIGAFDAAVRPFELLVGRRGEDDEETRGVGAVLVDQGLRIDAVVLRLRHLLGAADDDRLAVGPQCRTRRASLVVGDNVYIRRIEPLFFAAGFFTIEGRCDDHALRQQIGERLAEVADQADVAHQLGEEARVQQMQDGVLDATDVLVDAALAPVGDALVDHRLIVVRAAVAQEIPRGFDEGIHRIGFAPRLGTAFRAGAFVKFRHFGERRTGPGDGDIFRQTHRQLAIRHRHIVTVWAVDMILRT